MHQLTIQTKLETEIVTDVETILRYLPIGISLPILPKFHSYIIREIEAYNAKAIILKKDVSNEIFKDKKDNGVGITLIYGDGSETLFFGFCGTYDHDDKKIEILVKNIIDYAKKNGYKYIRGPVNIPAVIYGWGFMAEGSNKELFIGCPVNPPIYQEVFLKNGFYVKFKEDRYDVALFKFYPEKLRNKDGSPKYDFSEYEYINPSKEEIWNVLDEILQLHVDYMPPSAQIAPQSRINGEDHVEFIHEHGYEAMIWTVYHKPTKKMVACGYTIPNPFSRDKKGRLNSMSFHDWVVHPEHRRSGLAMLMYSRTANQCYKKGIRFGSWPVGAENEANGAAARKMGGKRDRRHLILEYKL